MFNLPTPLMPVPGIPPTPTVGTPVGTVVAFAGKVESPPSNPPSEYTTNIEALGWMLCDGRELLISQYPELYAVLGNLYGGEDGTFNIPDYRGFFLRGVDFDKSGETRTPIDPDKSDRTVPGGNENYDGVGSHQQDALQTHQHMYNETSALPEDKPPIANTGDGTPAFVTPQLTGKPTDELSLPPSPPNSGNVRHTKETRPKNVYVHYLIKYT